MNTIGLTGGIGMGKTAASDLVAQRGIPVLDTDLLARQLVEPGQAAIHEIAAVFGNQFLDEQGHLRRGDLARLVFEDASARQRLETILHPRIRRLWLSQIALWRAQGRPLALVVIPLLFETGAEREFNATVCVACSSKTQNHRLRTRGWSEHQIQQRINAQLPVEQKIARSDFVLWNEANLDVLADQLDLVLKKF
jgi:dephospho-CoA kinase